MANIHVSAPAKLFILGEHAVVFDGTAIVTAVDARLSVTIESHPNTTPHVTLDAPEVGLHGWHSSLKDITHKQDFSGESRFIESCIARFHQHKPIQDTLHITTKSHFARDLGLGSSSATVAATLFALAQLYAPELTSAQLFEMGLDAIRQVQKLGSGADLAAAIYGGTLYYVNQEPRQVHPIALTDLPMVAVYSGQKAGTVSYVKQVKQRRDQFPTIIDPIIATMLAIVDAGRTALNTHDWTKLGDLMNIQHGLLNALGVDTIALSEVVFAAHQADSLGAKLSGAGGGDCAIVLLDDNHAELQAALAHIGREILPYTLHAEGVRLEAHA